MYIGFSSSELAEIKPRLSEVSEFISDVKSKVFEPFLASGMKVSMSPAVVVAYYGAAVLIEQLINDLRNGKIVDMELFSKGISDAIAAFELACSTGVTVE